VSRYSDEIQILDSRYRHNKNIRFFDKTKMLKDAEDRFFVPDGYHLTEEGNHKVAQHFFN
jgi:hypothetical protein